MTDTVRASGPDKMAGDLHEAVRDEPRPISRLPWSYAYLILTGLLLVWTVFVFRAVYDFHTTIGRQISNGDLAHLGDLLTKLPRNLDSFVFLLVFLVSAIGLGDFALRLLCLDWRDEIERASFALATGLVVLTFVMLVLGSAGLLQQWACDTVFGMGIILTVFAGWGIIRRIRALPRENTTAMPVRRLSLTTVWTIATAIVLAFFLYFALLGGISPEFNFDARWYHLGSANSYAQHERFYNIVAETRLAVAAVDPYQTVLYAMLIKMYGLIAAKLLHWGDALLTALFLIYFCRVHFRSTIMGLVAAIVFVSTPLITWATSGGGNDLQLSLYILLSIHAFLRWRAQPQSARWLVVLGIMSGYALGSKLFGMYSLIILVVGIVALGYWAYWSSETPKGVVIRLSKYLLLVGGVVLLCCLPWLIRTYAMTGNPVFPVLNTVFKSPYWNKYAEEAVHTAYSGYGRNQSLISLLTIPWHAITGNNRYRAIFGPLFFLNLPICLALALWSSARAKNTFRLLGIYVTAWVLLWFGSGALELRYAVAIVPELAILVAFPLFVQRWPGWSGRLFQAALGVILAVVTVLNFNPLVPYQQMANLPTAFGHTIIPWEYLYHGQPENQVYDMDLPVVDYINGHLSPQRDKVYDFDGLILADCYSNITIFNGGGYDGPHGMREWNLYSPDAIDHFRQEHITYLAVTKEFGLPLKRFPLWPYLQQVYQSPGGNDFLYRVNYDAPATTAGNNAPVIDDFTFDTGWLPGTSEVNGQTLHFMEQDGQITVTMLQAQDVAIQFIASPILKPLTLEVRVNGNVVATQQFSGPGDLKQVSIDRVSLQHGTNRIELHAVQGCTRPSDITNSPDTRCFSISLQQVQITVQ